MLTIDKYAYHNRWIGVSPYIKTSGYMLLLILSLSGPAVLQAAICLLLVPLTMYVAKMKCGYYIKWFMLPFSFLLFSIISILISVSPSADGLLWKVQAGSLYLGISDATLQAAAQVLFRSTACLACTLFFVLTVPVQQLVKVMRTIHIPVLLIELMVLIYRFIFIFIEEAAAIRHAQQLRFGYHGLKNSYKSLAMLVNVLFQRVMLRYRDMSVVLDVKLFQGDFHV
ncbi:cobalt ECF transporter T component CbiQ [Paenibacillus thiaminolyticus]|uniref:Cobalt ECF transporter T component CbiQ n=1 Tax=Paenibacillus thiaminolyticus TaxID=49283 RepID=A0AAP9J1S3_PANTH|nr:cobalt ECF transporter T component CbiQ [Paenibacillus thiaminolyticus]MCY9538821.1 cobalt ECF transporter T component CbiQ [Paenibacillus thiaminolyticus]MCY9602836.1 cobalt ECF transporter T component CbiQ [Paenibacillus thiaminolyticus]MCY9605812.1 cobalt ECF transporter T component CbiQ [Paenibacillus thiaminolyticus]MCY9615528.1 cobalt ECF transporter T component CbiQ [Paenibacillus thiaminolyticus]MCY9621612.1 cobalt ECF transporter T component CbiQ [Paenibacillus thiaminolyticus]